MVSVADSDPEGQPCRRARIGAGQGAIWGEALAGPAVAALATIGPISSKRSGRADPRPAPSSRRRSRRCCPSPLCAIRGPESACREARAVQLRGPHAVQPTPVLDRGCQTGAVGNALAEDEDRVGRVAHHARNLPSCQTSSGRHLPGYPQRAAHPPPQPNSTGACPPLYRSAIRIAVRCVCSICMPT